MRKLYLFMAVSVDGYFEGKDHDLSWHNTDEEFNEFAVKQTSEVGTILFGRRTYEMMASYWPTPNVIHDDPEVAELMNSLPKIVFSKTLKNATWNNTTIISEDVEEKIKKLKEEEGNDLAIFGSSDLTVSLLKLGLVDEIRLMVMPVVLGEGKQLFEGLGMRLPLEFTQERTFKNGNVLLYYTVKK